MKKTLLMSMIAVFALSSCSEEQSLIPNGAGEEVKVSLNVNMPSDAATRAFADTQTYSNMRLVIAVMNDDYIVDNKIIDNWDGTSGGAVDFTLITGEEYSFFAWADYTPEVQVGNPDAVYGYYGINYGIETAWNQIGVTNLTIYTEDRGYGFDGYMPDGSNKNADAFTGYSTVTFNSDSQSVDIVLGRPFGVVKINTLDLSTPAIANAGIEPATYKLTTTSENVPVQFRPATGGVAVHATVKDVVIEGNISDIASGELSFDYFFAKEGEQTLHDFTVEYYDANGDFITQCDFVNIPVQRNYITNITGNILTTDGQINVTLDKDWDTFAVDLPAVGDMYEDGGVTLGKVFSVDDTNNSFLVVGMTRTSNATYDEAIANTPAGWRMPTNAELRELLAVSQGQEYVDWGNEAGAPFDYDEAKQVAWSEGLTDGLGGSYYWGEEKDDDNAWAVYFSEDSSGYTGYTDSGEKSMSVSFVYYRHILEVNL